MNPLILGPILEIGKSILDRFLPESPEKKAQMEMELFKMAAEGELKQVIAQLEINAKEAAHPSVWVAGWRPAFGWVGAVGFLYSVLLLPLLSWYSVNHGITPPPALENELLWVVVTGLLGIGGLRTYEKKQKITK